MTDRRRLIAGRTMAGFAAVVGVISIPIQLVFGDMPFDLRPDLFTAATAFAIAAAGFGVIVWVSLPSQLENRLVWVLAWAALFDGLASLGAMLASLNFPAELASEPAVTELTINQLPTLGALGISLVNASFVPGLFLVAAVGLLIFPDGRVVSPAWVWLLRMNVALIGVTSILAAVAAGPTSSAPVARNLPDFFTGGTTAVITGVLFVILSAGALLAIVALALSYRRSSGAARSQIQWIAFGGGVFLVGGMLRGLGFVGPAVIGMVVLIVSFYVAITKHRLYDITIVVSRTVTYLGLAAVVTLVYAAIVALPILVLGASDADFGAGGLALPFVATVIVAVSFEPLRARMQRWANRLVYGERSTPHEVLSQMTAGLGDAGTGADDLARLTALGTGATNAELWRRTGSMLVAEGAWPIDGSRVPVAIDEVNGFDAHALVVNDDEMLGAVTVTKDPSEPVTPADRELLENVAATAGLVLRNAALNRQLQERASDVRKSRQRLIAAQDAERHRLERDLHDGAQQQVVALKVKLGLAKTLAEREGAETLASTITALSDETQHAVDEMRAVAHGIYPPLLEAEGLHAALSALQRSAAVPVRVTEAELGRYDRSVEETAYFCIAELVESAHMAGAGQVDLEVTERHDSLVITIDHDGRELTDEDTLTDRVDAFGGTTTISDLPGSIRTVVSLPIPSRRLEPV